MHVKEEKTMYSALMMLLSCFFCVILARTSLNTGIKYKKGINFFSHPDDEHYPNAAYLFAVYIVVFVTLLSLPKTNSGVFLITSIICIIVVAITSASAYLYGRLRIRPIKAQIYKKIEAERKTSLLLQEAISLEVESAQSNHPPLAKKLAELHEAQARVSALTGEVKKIKRTLKQDYQPLADAIAAEKRFNESPGTTMP